MAHLYRPREGWEDERLAHYLLSRFSFVAQPTTVADDVGADFFCTIFDIIDAPWPTIEPRSSFAIQVKSTLKAVKAHSKVSYLANLELPFFLGIVSQHPAQIRLHSAERLPVLFARFGLPKKLWLRPVPMELYDGANYARGDAEAGVHLDCPCVATFGTEETRSSLGAKVEALNAICRQASANIGTRRAEEHVYDMGNGQFNIVAGCGSVNHFRQSFCRRLAEVFYNLTWIVNNQPAAFNHAEFKVYEDLYLGLRGIPGGAPLGAVARVYEPLRKQVTDRQLDR